jgi:Putative adhesin
MQKFDTPTPIAVVLDIPAGRIRLIAAERADTAVEVLPVNASKRRDVKVAEQIVVGYGDRVLRIEAPAAKNQYFGPSGSAEVTIQLPAGSSVEAKESFAEFRGVGRLGDVAGEAYGAVKIDQAASVRMAAHAGDVSIGRLTGPAEISTQMGNINIAEATADTVVLRTLMGDITVGAAHGVSASLDAGTRYGRIHNALMNTEGVGAGLNIHATTDHGDILARSL